MKMYGDERLTKSCNLEKLKLSKGDKFKYLFDFGDEWRFQCKVLRELEESVDIPCVIRSVGDSPEQYLQWEEEDSEDSNELLMEDLTEEQIDAIYNMLPFSEEEIALLRKYMAAASRLYGLISAGKLLEIYNSHNPPVDPAGFLVLTALVDCEDNPFGFITRHDVPNETMEQALEASELVADYLFVEDPDTSLRDLRRQQKGKQYKILPKAEFLKYADPDYFPVTPARTAMLKYLRRRAAKLTLPVEEFCTAIQEIIVIDAPMQEVVNIVEAEGLTFNKYQDIGEFAALYQNLNNSTHKHSNRGYTPDELSVRSNRGIKLAERIAPVGQMSLFDEPTVKPKLTIVGGPSRNGPCPCGSGRKYKNCCGK